MIVDTATEIDLDEIAALVNSAYRGESSRVGWTTEADMLGGQRTDPQSLRDELKNSDRRILCLRDEKTKCLLGCVMLERFADQGAVSCYVGMLTVQPGQQARGLGKSLLSHAEGFARQWGASKIVLHVIHVRHELIAWYERRGYCKTGEAHPFPYGDERFGVPKRPDLHFITLAKRI